LALFDEVLEEKQQKLYFKPVLLVHFVYIVSLSIQILQKKILQGYLKDDRVVTRHKLLLLFDSFDVSEDGLER
jgi:hypothetical protein